MVAQLIQNSQNNVRVSMYSHHNGEYKNTLWLYAGNNNLYENLNKKTKIVNSSKFN